MLEEHTQWANLSELYIWITKEAVRKDIRKSNSPLVLWDYCAKRRAIINNLTARNLFELQGHNPTMVTLGEEGDISNLCYFQWFEWCYFRDQWGVVSDAKRSPRKGFRSRQELWK